MDDLAPVIEQIALIASKAEVDRWELAEAIYTAFEELPHHTQGLLQGLCTRLKYSPTNVYIYKKAWMCRQYRHGDGYKTNLSVSHYAKIWDVGISYGLSGQEEIEYLQTAEEEGWSVLKLAQEVSQNHEPDPDGKYRKKFSRFVKLMRSLWNDPQFHEQGTEESRKAYYQVLKEMETI